MADPKRWLDSDEISPLERELLSREQDAAPDPRLRSAVWTAVVGGLPPSGGDGGIDASPGGADAGAAGAAVGAGAVAKLSSVGILKPFVIGLLSGGVAMTAVELGSSGAPPSPPRAPALAPATADRPTAPAAPSPHAASSERAPTAPESPRTAPAAPGPSGSSSAPSLESTLRVERDALTRARSALQSGQPGEALSILEAAERTIERPMLGQEREVVAIRALAASGRAEAARSRARQFVANFPDSPHTAAVRRLAGIDP
jgi:hypothetical protein